MRSSVHVALARSSTPAPPPGLLDRGLALVDRQAGRLARRLPPHVELEELRSAGREGLLSALASYDERGPARFEDFAVARVRGAMIDAVRASDPVSRRGRRRERAIGAARTALHAALRREPLEAEVAARLGWTLPDYRRECEALRDGEGIARAGGVDPDQVGSSESDPETECLRRLELARVAAALEGLHARTRRALLLRYCAGVTLAEIGRRFGVTESRACQIVREGVRSLRTAVEGDAEARCRTARRGAKNGSLQ